MKSQVLSAWNIPWLPSLALILFFTVFMVMLYFVFRKDAVERYKTMSEIPLSEGEGNE